MKPKLTIWMFAVAGALALAQAAHAQGYLCEESFRLDDAAMQSYRFGPPLPPPAPVAPNPTPIRSSSAS